MPWTEIQAASGNTAKKTAGQVGGVRDLSYRDAIREALDQALSQDPGVFLIGEGIDDYGGVFGSIIGLAQTYGSSRVMDMPLAENGLTGICAGAAMTGMRPVLIHMRVDFLPMSMDQIINHVAKWSYMTGGAVKVPLTIRAIIGRGWGSAAQHSQSLQALFAHIPGLNVVMPATPYDAKGMLLAAIAGTTPTLVLEHRWLYDQVCAVPEEPYLIEAGSGVIRRSGSDVTMVGISYMVGELMLAAEELEQSGISAEVIDLRSVSPIDEQIIVDSVRKTGRLLVADTGWKRCGISAEVAAIASERAFDALRAPVCRICTADCPTPASPVLEQAFYPNVAGIVAAVREMM
ncbi:MAG: transketolase C-terminal domain-containing protein [Desulfuromonadaceae bacterium]|nr:transketolase C-terminal domain-containing protein [Desulfuromonadaceae bacterium]MDD2854325.1 transketolase C-terminal domain-containing protein [Desulfuromonadaceae bacterium]